MINQNTSNLIINGNFDLWQRGITFTIPTNAKFSNIGSEGTTLTASFEPVADRWFIIDTQQRDAGSTGSITIYKELTNGNIFQLASSKNYITVSNAISAITGGYCYLENKQENCNRFAGNALTLSFSAKVNGGITGTTLDCYIRQVYSPPTGQFSKTITRVNVRNFWTSYSTTFLPDFIGSSGISGDHHFSIGFKIYPETNISIAGVKLEYGDTPTALQTDENDEKLRQSRYYYTTYPVGYVNGNSTLYNGNDLNCVSFTTTPNYSYNHKFDLPMYKQPTVTLYSPNSGVVGDGYNKTAAKDMRLTSGTRGWNLATRFSPTGAATLVATGNTYGVQLDISSGSVVFDDILVHVVADADFDFRPYDRGLET